MTAMYAGYVGGTRTLLSEVFYFDGVGFAVEPEDWIALGHCGGLTIHREGRD